MTHPGKSAPDLASYDVLLVNSSGGKDSQAMLDHVHHLAVAAGVAGRIVVVHCDLGRVEWEGTRDLAERQAAHYGHRVEVVRRTQNDLLDQIAARGMFPSSTTRYCTSDQKRGPVRVLMTRLASEWRASSGLARPCRILNCMGLRADESSARASKATYEPDAAASNGKRQVDTWLPIHAWTVDDVWARIRASGVPHHRAYDLGMSRLSCVFCVLGRRSDLEIAARHNPALLDAYVAVEDRIGHTFTAKLSLRVLRDEARCAGGAS